MYKTVIGTVFLLLLRHLSFADGYWLELSGSGLPGDTLQIRIRYGGVDEQKNRYLKNGTALDKMKDYQVWVVDKNGNKEPVVVKQYTDYWAGYYIPQKKGTYRVLAKDGSLPVVERPDSTNNIKPIQYLCASYQVTGDGLLKGPLQYLDLQVTIEKNEASIMAFIDDKPVVAGTPLRIFYPDNHDEAIVMPAAGKAKLNIDKKGLYLIRLDWMDRRSGVYENKRYFSIRHRCDYALQIN